MNKITIEILEDLSKSCLDKYAKESSKDKKKILSNTYRQVEEMLAELNDLNI